MQVTPELLHRAKKYNVAAITEIIEMYYARVNRMAYGLCSRSSEAKSVVRTVMKASLNQIPKWRHEDTPQRWFSHHTVLASRRLSGDAGHPQKDTLVLDPTADPQYLAFISAIRKLPFQQREAFILRFGEGFDARQLGAAMDLSTEAAQQHLKMAEQHLTAVAAERYSNFLATMSNAYQRHAPAPQIILPAVSNFVATHVWRRRIAKIIRLTIILALLIGVTGLIWYLKGRVEI